MSRTVRVGLIGADPDGGWARDSHIPALQALGGIALAAVAGRNQAGADAAARAFGVPKAYGSLEEMARDPEIDVITVAATLPSHRALLLPALEAGKHVYCEYPLGLDAGESRDLADAAVTCDRFRIIGLQARANPALRDARRRLASGALGRVLSARVLSTTAGFGPEVSRSLAYTEEPTNGVTLVSIQAAHTIDATIALLGGLDRLQALASRQFPRIRIDDGDAEPRRTFDHLLVQARTADGAPLSIEVAGGRGESTPFHLEVIGERGTLELEGGAPRGFQAGRLVLRIDGVELAVDEGALTSLPDAALNVAASYAALRDAILGGRDIGAGVGFDHAARLATLIADAQRSSASGERVEAGSWPLA